MALNRRRSTRTANALAGLALVAAGLTPATALPTSPGSPADGEASLTDEYDIASAPEAAPASDWEGVASDTGLWIVRLAGPSVAAYTASLEGQHGTASESRVASFDAQLEAKHSELVDTIDATLGRAVTVEFTYRNVLNGMAVEISEAEAQRLRELPGVVEVYPDTIREMDTDVSHEVILSDAVWDGETGNGVATSGEGITIGFIDSGVNPFHPSFAEVDSEGYEHVNPYGEGVFKGVCDADHPNHEDICNDKLVGAYNLNAASSSAIDTDDHGSHVGSTIAGNRHEADVNIGGTVIERFVQGVAPRANAISYKVCAPGCPSSATVAAVNNAITDDVDVLNYSISGSDFPWNDTVDLAFRDAAAAGISVVASAGNDGPGASTVAKTGPWMAGTAATTHHRVFAQNVAVTGPTPVPEDLTNMPGFPGNGPGVGEDLSAEIRSAADQDNFRACTPLQAGSMTGAIAFVERGDCTFPIKVENAQAAGAVGVIMGNNVGGPPSSPGGLENTTIPTVMIPGESSQALLDLFASTDEAVHGTISAEAETFLNEEWTDIMAGFSSRGPSQYDMLAPTYAAPGVNILAAAAAQGENTDVYAVLGGTSMSSPHAAGATALMRALHPDWTPTEIRSALALSADSEVRKENATTAADPFDMGSGRINLDSASRVGLVMDESIADMTAANPAIGGDPATLNLPAMVKHACPGVCSWTRTVTNAADVEATYAATTTAPDGLSLQVTPAEFTLAAGASQEVVIRATTAETAGAWRFGEVTFSTDATHSTGEDIADATLPVALKGTAGVPDITVDPEELDSTQPLDTVTTHELDVNNVGAAPLTWEFVDEAGTSVVAEQVQGGTGGIISDYFTPLSTGVYSADDFVLSSDVEVSTIFTPGFWNSGSLTNATQISWRIYTDADGVPSSQPEDGDDAVWAYDAAPTAPGVDITDNNISLDLTAAGADTFELEAGTYWLSVFPTVNTTGNDRWNWSQAGVGTGESAHLVDPSNLFGVGATSWSPLSDLGVAWNALAFTLEGPVSCGADWMSVDPASGTTAADQTSTVEVSLDSTGLALGTYTANLCIESDDADEPLLTVPVTLEVTEAPLELERWEGVNRYGTAAAVSSTYEPGVDVVFLATGLDYPDALTGSALAGSLDAPVLLTRHGGLPNSTKAELERLAPERVVVLGGSVAVSDAVLVEAGLLTGAPVQRVSGTNRYGTAAAVAAEFGTAERVFVATGADYPDALSAAARAGALDSPVLLVRRTEIPSATAAALDALAPSQITVLGAEGAVDQSVVRELRDWAPTMRTGGLNRWITSARLFAEVASAETVYVASGQNWPDALAGGAKAGSDHEPLLITRSDRLPGAIENTLERLFPGKVVVLGGTSAVSDNVIEEVRNLLDD